MKMETIRALQRDLGIKSYSTIYKWSKCINPVFPDWGEKLELVTGIDRRKFCWPKEFGNPWPDVEMIYKNKIMINSDKGNG